MHAGKLKGDLTTCTFRIGSFGNDFDVRVEDVLITNVLPSPVPALTRAPRLVLLLGMGLAGGLILLRK